MEKVVIIGLGGIGSSVVQKVHNLMNNEERKHTVVAVLDTDINTTGLGDIEDNGILKIATSPTDNVDTLLTKEPAYTEWFPEHELLKTIDIRSGAGQIRAVSRLALNYTMDRGSMNELQTRIQALNPVQSEASASYRVLIINSIAGGTGSGSFLQMGMYLREFFRSYLPNQSVQIFGFFLLPDIIINTTAIERDKHDDIRTNTYAALKELNAMVSPTLLDKVGIQLQYSKTLQNNINISKQNRPYDFVLMYDYENSKSENMRRMGSYIDQIVNSVYFGFVTPMADKFKGRLVNDIANAVANNGENFYSGTSVNRLIYPYNDLVDYFSSKYIQHDINENWLRADQAFEHELSEYDENSNYEKPELGKSFVKYINNLENDIYNEPRFWQKVFYDTREHQNRVVSGIKPALFLKKIGGHIQERVSKQNEVQQHLKACSAEEQKQNLQRAESQSQEIIRRLENNRILFEHDMSNLAQTISNYVLNNVVSDLCRDRNTDAKYSLKYWLANSSAERSMHPLAIRYFLYVVQARLKDALKKVTKTIEEGNEAIKGYDKKFNIKSDKDSTEQEYYESPQEVLEIIDNVSFAAKFYHSLRSDSELNRNSFIDKYVQTYNEQLGLIMAQVEYLVTERVYTKLLQYVEIMLKDWEALFRQLDIVTSKALHVCQSINQSHAEDDVNIYLFETEEKKEKLWEAKIKGAVLSDQNSSDVANRLAHKITEHFCMIIDPDVKVSENENYVNLVFDAYKDSILASTEAVLDINVNDAVLFEGDKQVHEYIDTLISKNWPWIQCNAELNSLKRFFGINRSLNDTLNIDTRKGDSAFDASFSKYEVVYAVLQYGLSVSQFEKFTTSTSSAGIQKVGSYFKAYYDRLDNLEKYPTRFINPHLDKNWTKTTHIPDLNNHVEAQRIDRIQKAFVLGLVNSIITVTNVYGDRLYTYVNPNGAHTIQRGAEVVHEGEWMKLYVALELNSGICSLIINKHLDALKKDEDKFSDLQDDIFITKIVQSNILFMLMQMAISAKTAEESQIVLELFTTIKEVVEEYIREKNGIIRIDLSERQIGETITYVWDQCREKEQYKETQDYLSWKIKLFNES